MWTSENRGSYLRRFRYLFAVRGRNTSHAISNATADPAAMLPPMTRAVTCDLSASQSVSRSVSIPIATTMATIHRTIPVAMKVNAAGRGMAQAVTRFLLLIAPIPARPIRKIARVAGSGAGLGSGIGRPASLSHVPGSFGPFLAKDPIPNWKTKSIDEV